MQVESHYYEELQQYISEDKYDYAMQVIEKSGIDSPIVGMDRKNLWFHYLCGQAYLLSDRPLGALSHLGAFVKMASDNIEMEVDHKMYGIRIPTLEQMANAGKMLAASKKAAREMLSEKPEFSSAPDTVETKLNEYQNTYIQKKGGCFIATAVYGSATAYEVTVLREFRDARLLRSHVGRAFVRVYYAWSPAIAALLQRVSPARVLVRKLLLAPIVRFAERCLPRR